MKQLKIWNGRGFFSHKTNINWARIYVCAHSVSEAIRIGQEAGYINLSRNEVNNYWSEGCWGNPMKGITQEVGVWGTEKGFDGTPVKIA